MRGFRRWAQASSVGALLVLTVLSGCGACEKSDVTATDGGLLQAAPETATEVEFPKTVSPPDLHLTGARGRSPAPPKPAAAASRVLPPRDLTGTALETEPNDDPETASPLDADYAAKGRLEGRERDVFVFEVEGEAQLWSIEARGDNIEAIAYLSARSSRTTGTVSPDDPALHTLTNIYLLPGKHWIELRSRGGSAAYTIRAVPLGPPEPGMELEPNDAPESAHLLRFGETRTGHLFETRDRDHYRFNLAAEEQVALELTPPPGVTVNLHVTIAGRKGWIRIDVPEDDGTLRYRALLPLGQHLVEVRAVRGRSDRPYALRLDRLNPYLLAVDLEPNDEQREAAPFPPDLRLEGSTRGRSDPDWYRLPRLDGPASTTVEPGEGTLEGFPERDGLLLYDEAGKKIEPGFVWDPEASNYRADLPAGQDLFVRVRGFGQYAYRFTSAGIETRTREEPRVAMAVPAGPHRVAAFWHEGQRVELALGLRNPSRAEADLELDATSTDHRWRAALDRSRVILPAGEEVKVPVVVHVPRDAWTGEPVYLTVRATDEAGAIQTAATRLEAVCGVPAVDPQPFRPLPDAMLGGLNLAWSALGGRIEGDGKAELLIDGFTPNDADWKAALPATVTVDLAGERAVPITGILLNPKGRGEPGERVREFSVEASSDGATYQRVLTGVLGRQPFEQAFPFETPVEARSVRLTVHSSHLGTEGKASLGEFKVVAAPGERPDPDVPLDLGALQNGGHVVWADPIIHRPNELLTADTEEPKVRLDGLRPFRWVVGFQHGRAALVEALEWVQSARSNRYVKLMTEVQVAISVESPAGPWIPLESWKLDPEPNSVTRLELPQARWVRYLRFTHSQATRSDDWYVPETLRVVELASEGDYRSILGEWGQYSRSAVYEWSTEDAVASDSSPDTGGETRSQATPLELDRAIADQVEIERDIDWFRIRVPRGHNRLTLDLQGEPDLRAVPTLYDAGELRVQLAEVTADESRPPVFEATVEPGDYYLHLEEPPRSIAFVWDNSGSVAQYRPTIYQALADFATGIRRGSESANLLPFQGPGGKFLLDEWTDDRYVLQRAVNDYDKRDSSSDAASALIQATKGLAARSGAKALLVLTDADFGGYVSKPQAWSLLNEVRPRIFSLELHRGAVAAQQDMMQDWASVNGGHYTYFSTNADLEIAFQRASCLLRRPARYTLTASSRYEEPPAPGALSVSLDEGVVPTHAIELVLDASGSMLQRLGSKRRIDIAKDVLLELVTEILPPNTPLALRIFGHREAGSCRTDLEVPLGPLDRDRVAAAIRQTQAKNLAKTPIADSLRLVAEDLKAAEGQRLVVLITDGEETCDGDPATVVEELAATGIDVRLNIVGFAIEDEALKADFARWAGSGGGRYFDAADEEALGSSLKSALQPKFQAIDAGGSMVAEGTVGGPPVELPVGSYSVRVLTTPLRTFDGVRVESESETKLSVGASD